MYIYTGAAGTTNADRCFGGGCSASPPLPLHSLFPLSPTFPPTLTALPAPPSPPPPPLQVMGPGTCVPTLPEDVRPPSPPPCR